MEKDFNFRRIDGFTLIELIVVIAILGILVAMAVPRFSAFRQQAEKITCETNRKQLETYYQGYMELNGLSHTTSLFAKVKEESFGHTALCPVNGIIDWNNGKVTCSIHIEDASSGGNEDEELTKNFLKDQPWITTKDGGSDADGKLRCIRAVNTYRKKSILINNEGYRLRPVCCTRTSKAHQGIV